MKNNKFKCPKCGGNVSIWSDLDAEVTFQVGNDEELTVKEIKNVRQTDGRCGVECDICDWELNHLDDFSEHPHFEVLANKALDYQYKISRLLILSLKE